MDGRWGLQGPPDEAYSRVSDPERYRPLHRLATTVVEELAARFAVERQTLVVRDPHGTGPADAVRLLPSDSASAHVTLVLTSFPGVEVRFGHDDVLQLPICGCDACDQTVEECEQLLREHLSAVTGGTFGERLVNGADGWAHERWYVADTGSWSSRTPVTRAERADLESTLPRTWAPWQPRSPGRAV